MQTLVLHEPTRDNWAAMMNRLQDCCNKQDLLRYAEAFTPWIKKYARVVRSNDEGQSWEATETELMTKSGSPKNVIAQGIALILADDRNLRAYTDSFSDELRQLWKAVLGNVYVTHDRAKAILKTSSDLFGKKRSYYYSEVAWNKREYGWFSTVSLHAEEAHSYGFRDFEQYICLNHFIHSVFFPIFYPEAFLSDSALDQLPGGNWRTLSFEAESLANFQLFCGLILHDEFPLKKKGIGVADMKQAQKKMALEEFFPGDSNEYRANLRAYSYLQLLALHYHCILSGKKKVLQSYEDTLRDLIEGFKKLAPFISGLLYPHIKGLRKQITEYGREQLLAEVMFSWLREEPDGWIHIRDLFLKIFVLSKNTMAAMNTATVYNPANEQYSTEITNDYTHRTIAASTYAMEFGYSGLQMLAFLLASTGIVEIAVNEDAPSGVSPFSALEYVRLTPLGRYALGLTNTYEVPQQEQAAYFELDPDRLIIRSLVEPNPYAQLLLDTSRRISHNRFEMSALTFLANCHTRQDVESKISIFRQFISSELPPLWQQFFLSLLQHCHPLTEDRTNYKRYTIAPDNRDLIALITTDPALRQMVIRAEGYRILVKTEDLKKFELQLKKHGYLL